MVGTLVSFILARPTFRSYVSFRDSKSTSEKLNDLSQKKIEGFANKRTRNFARTKVYTFQSLGGNYHLIPFLNETLVAFHPMICVEQLTTSLDRKMALMIPKRPTHGQVAVLVPLS